MRFSIPVGVARSGLASATVFVLFACAPAPDANSSEELREIRCREQAQKWCAANAPPADVDACVGKRAWDCDLAQTPADMERRADIPVEGAVPDEPAVINPGEAEGNSYPGTRWDNP